MIYLVGLGAGGVSELSREALDALKRARRLFLRTKRHPAASALRLTGLQWESMDDLEENQAEYLPLAIAEHVLAAAREASPVAYAVPGHPLMGDETVRCLLERARVEGIPTRLVPSRSVLEAVLEAVGYSLIEGCQLINATALPYPQINPHLPQIYYPLSNRHFASELQRFLRNFYPPDFPLTLVHAAGIGEETRVCTIPLSELDRQRFDPQTSLFVPPLPSSHAPKGFPTLVQIVATLRGPNGCPWDKEQTPATLKPYLLEECYEVLEAIEEQNPHKLCEELGDLLLQVVMQAQLAREVGAFDIEQVIETLCEKLIRRHPHVFGDTKVANAEEVLKHWDALKRAEEEGKRLSILDGIPKTLPALQRALDVSKRAARAGFEWENLEGVFQKLDEEKAELQAAIQSGHQERIEAEIGDLLFTLVNIARHAKVNPEEALRRMVDRFIRRFKYMEQLAEKQQVPLMDLDPDQWETLWQQAKQLYREEEKRD